MARMRIELPDTLPFATDMSIRVSDLNYGGHLGNDSVLRLVHEARVRFLRSHGWTETDVAGTGMIMADAAIVYRNEAFHGEILTIHVGVGEIRPTRCDFLYRLERKTDQVEIARVRTAMAFFDYQTRSLVRSPEAFVRCFSP